MRGKPPKVQSTLVGVNRHAVEFDGTLDCGDADWKQFTLQHEALEKYVG